MATTQAQRASLFNTLAELMGEEDAETLMQQLPPGDWDTMATKDDLQVLGATLAAMFTAALAEFRVEVTDAFAELRVELANGFAEAAKERAAIIKSTSESHAELVKSQARHLYITVSTICLATISIWIALLAGPAGG